MIRKVEPPIKTKYKYRRFLFVQGQPALDNMVKLDCEIIFESDTQYKIRLLQGTPDIPVGCVKWVKKKNVDYKPQVEYDYTDAFWNK